MMERAEKISTLMENASNRKTERAQSRAATIERSGRLGGRERARCAGERRSARGFRDGVIWCRHPQGCHRQCGRLKPTWAPTGAGSGPEKAASAGSRGSTATWGTPCAWGVCTAPTIEGVTRPLTNFDREDGRHAKSNAAVLPHRGFRDNRDHAQVVHCGDSSRYHIGVLRQRESVARRILAVQWKRDYSNQVSRAVRAPDSREFRPSHCR